MFKNWKTSTAGCVGGLPIMIDGITTHNWGKAIYGLGLILVGVFSKDADHH